MGAETGAAPWRRYGGASVYEGIQVSVCNAFLKYFSGCRNHHQTDMGSNPAPLQDADRLPNILHASAGAGTQKGLVDTHPAGLVHRAHVVHAGGHGNLRLQPAYIKDICLPIFKIPVRVLHCKRTAGPAGHIVKHGLVGLHVSCLCPHLHRHVAEHHTPCHIQLFHIVPGELNGLIHSPVCLHFSYDV